MPSEDEKQSWSTATAATSQKEREKPGRDEVTTSYDDDSILQDCLLSLMMAVFAGY
jgi:hypothetical protein